MNALEEISRELEHFETDLWAADNILNYVKFIGVKQIHDPCTGTGILAEAVKRKHPDKKVIATDIHDWGYKNLDGVYDYLESDEVYEEATTVIMNPPFSKACQFIEKAFELGAYQVLCFQRKAWRESLKRREFWRKYPPFEMYVCGERATCWRHDISMEEREARGGTPTPHAWFYFLYGHNSTPVEYILYKDGGIV